VVQLRTRPHRTRDKTRRGGFGIDDHIDNVSDRHFNGGGRPRLGHIGAKAACPTFKEASKLIISGAALAIGELGAVPAGGVVLVCTSEKVSVEGLASTE